MPLASRPSSPASSSGYPGTAPGAGHRPLRDWDGPLEGLGWTTKGLGIETQRDRNGRPKSLSGLVLPQTSLWGHSKPWGHPELCHGYHGHPHGDTPCPDMPRVPCHCTGWEQHTAWGSPCAGTSSGSDPPVPVEQPPGGWQRSAPAARHLNLGASGGCHHVCQHMGGSSTAAAGMWPWRPRVGGAGSSPGIIPAPGTEGSAGARADPPTGHVLVPHAPRQCHLPDFAVAPSTGDNYRNAHPHAQKGGDGVGRGLWRGRTRRTGRAG